MKENRGRKPTTPRTMEDILASGVAKLRAEGPRVVPCSYHRLRSLAIDGRLKTFGTPESVDVKHLQQQYRENFPVVDDAAA